MMIIIMIIILIIIVIIIITIIIIILAVVVVVVVVVVDSYMTQILPGITTDLTCQSWSDLELTSLLAMGDPI